VCKAFDVVKGERPFRLETIFLTHGAIKAAVNRRVVHVATVPSATRPLDIVSFLLTPQVHRRKIPATFPFLFWSREPERKRSRVVASGFGLYFYAERFLKRGARQNLVLALLEPVRIKRGRNVQYLPGWTVQCINPECLARGHWLRAAASGGELCSNCNAPLHNVPPPLGPRLRLRPRSLGSYRPPGRSPGRPR